MNEEKQIEAMAKVVEEASCGYGVDGCHRCEFDGTEDFSCAEMRIAKTLYNAGYRKQSEGEWEKRTFIFLDVEKVGFKCSNCNTTWDTPTKFCPNCGARMKGDAE